ncbi:MAG: cation-transporting P-type ATPase [Collinsella sp.]
MSKNTIFAATHSAEDALVLLDATADGLIAEHAAERLSAVGPNTIEAPTKTLARRIADAFVDPFAGILAALALVSLYIDVLAVPELQRDLHGHRHRHHAAGIGRHEVYPGSPQRQCGRGP